MTLAYNRLFIHTIYNFLLWAYVHGSISWSIPWLPYLQGCSACSSPRYPRYPSVSTIPGPILCLSAWRSEALYILEPKYTRDTDLGIWFLWWTPFQCSQNPGRDKFFISSLCQGYMLFLVYCYIKDAALCTSLELYRNFKFQLLALYKLKLSSPILRRILTLNWKLQ